MRKVQKIAPYVIYSSPDQMYEKIHKLFVLVEIWKSWLRGMPAYFVNANIHCGEVTGSMTAMCLLGNIFNRMKTSKIQITL